MCSVANDVAVGALKEWRRQGRRSGAASLQKTAARGQNCETVSYHALINESISH